MNRPHGNSCFCLTCATIFAEGKNEPILQRPKKGLEKDQEEAPAGQAQDDSSRTPIPGPYSHYFLGEDNLYEYNGIDAPKPLSKLVWGCDTEPVSGPLRVKWVEDILRDFHERTATLHPHTNCPRCLEEKKPPEAGDPELEALIPCMRTSAQEILAALHKKGWKIVQK